MAVELDSQRLEVFFERVLGDLVSTYGGVMTSLGHKLGLYAAMAGAGRLGAAELAERAGCAERYVREWLSSQAAGGYVEYHAEDGSFELTPEQAAVLADADGPMFLPVAWEVPASMWLDQERAIEAFRTGEGVPWGDHHERLFSGCAAFFRNGYAAQLVQSWLPALDGVEDRLQRGARVADVGCGYGHSTVIMARAYPASDFTGFDSHPGSVAAARRNAERAGVATRTRFCVASSGAFPGEAFDLICFFDCLHDLGDPVAAASRAAEALAPGGSVMLVEPFAGDRLEDNLNPVGRLYYSASTTLCCAHSLSEPGAAALGAQAGEARLAEVFRQAGFRRFERVAQTPFNLIFQAGV